MIHISITEADQRATDFFICSFNERDNISVHILIRGYSVQKPWLHLAFIKVGTLFNSSKIMSCLEKKNHFKKSMKSLL